MYVSYFIHNLFYTKYGISSKEIFYILLFNKNFFSNLSAIFFFFNKKRDVILIAINLCN